MPGELAAYDANIADPDDALLETVVQGGDATAYDPPWALRAYVSSTVHYDRCFWLIGDNIVWRAA
jgi:hypothetical protein